MKKKPQKSKGFTLIELLVAIVILGIIVIMSIPQISNLIDSNSDRKFEAYEETIRTSGKLYTDAYNQDMFGNNTSGCYDIEYSAMEDKKLIKDVNIHNATCNGGSQKKTFVRVYKSGDVYKYKVSILCTDKNNVSTVLYSNTIDGDIAGDTDFCDGKTPDFAGPNLAITSSNADGWLRRDASGFRVGVQVSDPYGLKANIEIQYAWVTDPNNIPASAWKTHEFNNAENEESVSIDLTSTVPATANSDYYLVVHPSKVIDHIGNHRTERVQKVFKFDNTAPTCTITITSGTKGLSNWYITKPTINMTYLDSRGSVEKYGLTTSTTASYNSKKNLQQGDTTGVKYYGYVKDYAGNVGKCELETIKVDTTPPTKPSTGTLAISGSNASATLAAAGGSTDATSGILEYRYVIQNASGAPANTSASYTTSRSFTRACGKSYYAYAIAVDKAGNKSPVYSMGSKSDAANSYSAWSTCSKSCGGGTQTRTNTCALITTGLSQSCNTQECCSAVNYSAWSSWSTCSKSCGTGTQSRTRKKTSQYTGVDCGTETETRNCNTMDCCSSTYTTYSGYGSCSASCGGGKKYRTGYTYSNYNGQQCSSWSESASCNTQGCCDSTYGNGGYWSGCSASCDTGTQNYYSYRYSNYNGQYCGEVNTDWNYCNTHSCCGSTYGDGGYWTSCSADCGGGTQDYYSYRYSNYNGQYCGTEYWDWTSCNTHSCYSCNIQYYTSVGTYCWNAAKNMIGSGSRYGELDVCTGYDSGCVSANDSRCNKMGGTYLYFKYCG